MSIPDLTPIDPDSIPSDSTPNTTGDAPRKRRGRPPGSSSTGGTRRVSAADKRNVETALSTMGTLYSSVSAAMLLLNKPNTAEMLSQRIEQTQAANRQAFEASPALASTISKLGQVSSISLFIGSNVAMAAAVFMTYRLEVSYQRAMAEQQQRPQAE